MKRNKKGFTIVELAIVIAVIGVLTAILIPTFINLTSKAGSAADDALVANLNKRLAIAEQEDPSYETTTYQHALDIVEDAGYKVPNLVCKSGEDLFWNQKTNRFCIGSKKDSTLPDYTYWTIKDALTGDETYSVYAGLNFQATKVLGLKAGFDIGNNKTVKEVSYVGSTSKQEGVTFRFSEDEYFTDFENNNSNQDGVKIYGNPNSVNSEKSGQQSLYIYNDVASLQIKEGHVVIAPGVKIGSLIFKTTSENNFDKIVVEIPNLDEQVTNIYRSGVSTNLEAGVKVEVATIKTTETSETYFLEGNGTIEDSKLLVSNTGNVADAVAVTTSTASDAAKAIANAKDPDTGNVIDTGKSEEQIQEAVEEAQTEKQTEVVEKKAEEEGEDFSKYEARIGLKGYDSIRTAIDSAKEGETVILLKDVSLGKVSSGDNVALSINKNFTLNGNGNTITTTAGRGIWINDSGVDFTVKNLIVNGNTLERAIQINSNLSNVKLNVLNCDFTATMYCMNICSNTNHCDITVKESTFTGWSALNSYASNSSFTFENSTLVGINRYSSASNDYATIVFDGGSIAESVDTQNSINSTVSLKGCTVIAKELGTNNQNWINFQYGADDNRALIEIDSNTVFLDDFNGNDIVEKMMISSENSVKLNLTEAQREKVLANGLSATLNEDGTYTVVNNTIDVYASSLGGWIDPAKLGEDLVLDFGSSLDGYMVYAVYGDKTLEFIDSSKITIEGSVVTIDKSALHKFTNGDWYLLIGLQAVQQ